MSIPRDHHFIPVFYLKQWVGPNGKLIEYTRKHGKLISKPVGPRGTGFQTDLYSFTELPPALAHQMESEFLKYVDDKASVALKKHLDGDKNGWTSELVSAWSRFILGMYIRHPDAMAELRLAVLSVWQNSDRSYEMSYQQIRQPSDPPTFDEYLAQKDPVLPIKIQAYLIREIFNNEKIGTHLNNMKHAVIDVSRSPFHLLTSDRPITLYNLARPEGYVSLPISPTKLFVGANETMTLTRLRGTSAKLIVQRVNADVVFRARRFVCAGNTTQERFVRNRISKHLEPTPLFPELSEAALLRRLDEIPPIHPATPSDTVGE